jgi:aminopeptidase N
MQSTQPKTIHLKDYRRSTFLIDSISLDVDIFDDKTIVRSTLEIIKGKDFLGRTAHLELNGESVILKSLKMNGVVLSADQFQLSSDKLVILNINQDQLILEIENEIDPFQNKACEGFYQSGDQLCTQCEPEGFRKITYYIDRPDVMAKFKTRISANKERFPFLLSNGNRINSGSLPMGRHFVEWEDPFRKPSYLFAMVAGDFDVARDTFKTMKGRNIDLEIYVDKGNLRKTPHAMESLKKAMKWDEETFGLEYDLDIYMIVAVDSFNMGAMENKGLNIFNSTYTLADEASATDHDFQNIEGVIGHEYFHNWTGNRITCRDWFQLTLKEGLTVYRDQEFSSDILSRAVKRLEDVRLLKEGQFSEDAGPLSHPIRPTSYIEINNFYTRTVYEKGAEVIRMIETLIGKDNFRKGMDKYFELYDGQAVTTDDFVHSMELASGIDLSQFKNWYSRPGTPTLVIKSSFEKDVLNLKIDQHYPPTILKVPEGNILHMPFKLAFLFSDGFIREESIEIKKMSESFQFKMDQNPILSLNRSFSAPVHVEFDYNISDLLRLMSFDSDPYCRYEATQKVYQHYFKLEYDHFKQTGIISDSLDSLLVEAFEKLLADNKIDFSFKTYLLDLPSENSFAQEMPQPDFDTIHLIHSHLKKKLGVVFQDWFLTEHEKLSSKKQFELNPKAYGERSLKNQILSYLVASDTSQGKERLKSHHLYASNMTEEVFALAQYVLSGVPMDHESIMSFYHKWKHDSLVMLKWFGTLASYSPKNEVLQRLVQLENDSLFQKDVPNYLRALYVQFARNNLHSFHNLDGSSYRFLAERIKTIDSYNPQVASRAASSFSMIDRVDSQRQLLMKLSLKNILEGKPSRDTFEVVSKYLAQ